MTPADITRSLIAEQTGRSLDEVQPHVPLADLMDDMDRWGLLMDIEHRFAIGLDDDAMEQWQTVADVVACVERAMQGEVA